MPDNARDDDRRPCDQGLAKVSMPLRQHSVAQSGGASTLRPDISIECYVSMSEHPWLSEVQASPSEPSSVHEGITTMELRHLRYFIAVAEELNFARAAQRIHIEPSPLSRAIRELEDNLGAQLFERSHKGMRLTWPGKVFLEEAQRILSSIEDARS